MAGIYAKYGSYRVTIVDSETLEVNLDLSSLVTLLESIESQNTTIINLLTQIETNTSGV